MATRTKEDNALATSLQRVVNDVEEAVDSIGAALATESRWKASKAASAYKKALQDAKTKIKQAETAMRDVAKSLY